MAAGGEASLRARTTGPPDRLLEFLLTSLPGRALDGATGGGRHPEAPALPLRGARFTTGHHASGMETTRQRF